MQTSEIVNSDKNLENFNDDFEAFRQIRLFTS